jgi:hypothetical protein
MTFYNLTASQNRRAGEDGPEVSIGARLSSAFAHAIQTCRVSVAEFILCQIHGALAAFAYPAILVF